jgi:hypothetical protein
MSIAGTFPEQGVRVALTLRDVGDLARYDGEAYTPNARYELLLSIDVSNGKGTVEITSAKTRDDAPAPPLDAPDAAFIKQLGMQLFRQAIAPADQGGGTWARRVQRWRGPK